jgi:hypothetical protein
MGVKLDVLTRREHRLRVFERRIFGPKGDEVTNDCRTFHTRCSRITLVQYISVVRCCGSSLGANGGRF